MGAAHQGAHGHRPGRGRGELAEGLPPETGFREMARRQPRREDRTGAELGPDPRQGPHGRTGVAVRILLQEVQLVGGDGHALHLEGQLHRGEGEGNRFQAQAHQLQQDPGVQCRFGRLDPAAMVRAVLLPERQPEGGGRLVSFARGLQQGRQ